MAATLNQFLSDTAPTVNNRLNAEKGVSMFFLMKSWKKLSLTERRDLARLLGLAFVRGGLFSYPLTLIMWAFAPEDRRLLVAVVGIEMSSVIVLVGLWLLFWGCIKDE